MIKKLVGGALVSVAVGLVAAPSALGQDTEFAISTEGSFRPVPGRSLDVFVSCPEAPTDASSPVLTFGPLELAVRGDGSPNSGHWVGSATIVRDATPGSHPASISCQGRKLTTTVTVAAPEGDNVVRSLSMVDGSRAKPGQVVHAQIVCEADDPEVGRLSSPVLDSREWHRDPNGHSPLSRFAAAVVKASAKPGRYRVTATCAGQQLSATITVVAVGSGHQGHQGHQGQQGHQVGQVPVGAPETGSGPVDAPEVDTVGLVAGLGAGSLAAGGALALLARRRRGDRAR